MTKQNKDLEASLNRTTLRLQKLIDGNKNSTLSEATAKFKQARYLLSTVTK